jgi:hypothetical protein
MSDASRHAAFIVAESIYGETPATPLFKRLRHTAMTLGVQRGSLQSEELREDRQISDFRLGAVSVAGDITTELSYGSFDDLLEAVCLGTWTPSASKAGTTISALAVDSSLNDSAAGFVTAGFQVGDIVDVSGFTGTPANNGTFIITSVTSSKLLLDELPGGTPATFVDDAAGEAVTVATVQSTLKAGTTRRSFSLLRHFTDIDATGEGLPYHLFKGVEFNTLALAVNPTAIISATFGTLGREGAAPSNTPPAGSVFGSATTSAPLDAFTGELRSGVDVVGVVTEYSINLENGLEVRNVVGSKLTIRPSIGRSNLTGSATVYFENATFLKKFIDEEDSSLSIELPDGDGNSYVVTIPRLKFTGGQPDVSGQGSITLSMPFQGLYDPASGSNIVIIRKPTA